MTTKEDSPAEKVLHVIELKLQTSRDKLEREILKGVLLAAGITAITNSNSKDNTFVVRKQQT